MAASDVAIVTADTVTVLDARHAGVVLVTGSHGGLIAARYAARAKVRAVVFNDAGGGLDDAGVAGLAALDAIGVAAAAVAHTSARIADATDSLAHGIVSRANACAKACGVVVGSACRTAAMALQSAPRSRGELAPPAEGRYLFQAIGDGPAVIGLDSIGLVRRSDAGATLVLGSHGALHGADAATALPIAAFAAFFHDAGWGKDDAGVSRLPVLARRGIPAGAVDYRTARIGDARSMWRSGVLSCVNEPCAAFGVRPGISLQEAAARLRPTL